MERPFALARILRKQSRGSSVPYKCELRLLHDRLINHRPRQVTIVHSLRRRLHPKDGNELLLRIDPKIRSRDAAPRKVADRSRQRITSGMGSHRESKPKANAELRRRSQRAE